MTGGRAPVWPPFVWASLGLAITAGFGLGAALFAAQALQAPIGLWWPAAAQAHGHTQLFGWIGLMVLGVGFHVLPRLRGAPLAHRDGARAVLVLLVAGLVLRALVQPLLAVVLPAAPRTALRVGLVCSGVLEVAGVSLALWLLARTLRHGPSLRTRAGLWPVLPFFVTAFAGFWLALGVNLVGLISAAMAGSALVPAWADGLTTQLAFYVVLVPVSMAMSERTFPLFYRTPLPKRRALRVGLVVLLTGLALRVYGELGAVSLAIGLGCLAMAVALSTFILALGVFAPRRPRPRGRVRPLSDPLQAHVLAAYLWLMVATVLLVAMGLAAWGITVLPVGHDAERHALGSGFGTLLILGVGAHLLPGFANRPLRSRALAWATLVLGNAAALLRVGPLFLPSVAPPALTSTLLSLAGVAGLAALVTFGLNVSGPRRPGGRADVQHAGADGRASGCP